MHFVCDRLRSACVSINSASDVNFCPIETFLDQVERGIANLAIFPKLKQRISFSGNREVLNASQA